MPNSQAEAGMSENPKSLSSWSRGGTGLLILLLGAGLAFRLWGIWFGLPFLFHNDEGFEVIRALQLGAGEFDFGRIAKGGYFYLLFVEYGVLFAVLLMAGVVGSAGEFAEYFIADPAAFYLVGRATTAVIGTVTILLVFRIGRLAYSTSAGLIAAAFLAFNVLHSYLSHLITVDVPMTCLATASLYFAVKVANGGSAWDYRWAALLAALATTTKFPAILLLVPLVLAHYYCISAEKRRILAFFGSSRVWQAVAIFLVAYLALTPGMLLYGGEVFWHMLAKFGVGSDAQFAPGSEGLEPDERALFVQTNLFVYYIKVLIDSMTMPVFILCMGGLLFALWRRTRADVVLASFAIVTYLAVSMSADPHQFFPRYMLPAIPVLVLLGARLLDTLIQSAAPVRRQRVAGIIVLLFVAWPVNDIIATNQMILMQDTRASAREWMDANIPEGSTIFIEGHRTTLSKATVPLQNTTENIEESIEYYRGTGELGRVRYFQTLLKVQKGRTFDLLGVQPDDLQDLQDYKDIGVQYFVLRPEDYRDSRVRFAWDDLVKEIRVDPDLELLKRFEPLPGADRSPVIEVYRVNSNVREDRAAEVSVRSEVE
jgi:4-amino-4-deoxy-L-arabinose transferase-like glycosyltransferase